MLRHHSGVGMSSMNNGSPQATAGHPAQHCDCCTTGTAGELGWNRCCVHFVLSTTPIPANAPQPLYLTHPNMPEAAVP